MKNVVAIAILSFSSLLFIVVGFFVLWSVNPEMFGGAKQTAKHEPKHESVRKKVKETNLAKAEVPKTDTVSIAQSIPQKETSVKKDSAATIKSSPAVPITQVVVKDTTDWKSKAKIFEAMSIEDASNILKQLKDKEVKLIMVHIKKRNAAKILASFEPARAAKIIR